ncbi:MAG: hypothetical protein QMC93_00310 [Patescibacteria group bacterium]|nr:hypothetical protein [Patescibacteria group bacterium]
MQILKKTSFISGIILLFSPIVFSSLLKFGSELKNILLTFSPDNIISYILALFVIILEIIFFIKIFKSFFFREPCSYFLIYFVGTLTLLAALGSVIMEGGIISLFLFILLLLSLVFYHSQKNQLFSSDEAYFSIGNKMVFLFSLNVGVAIVSFVLSYLIWLPIPFPRAIFPSIISVLIVLPFFPLWRKKIDARGLRGFIVLLATQLIITELIFQLTIFLSIFNLLFQYYF